MEREMIIIGAGTAGLTASCYAQMNGYQTTILRWLIHPAGCVHPGGEKVICSMAASQVWPVLLQAARCTSYGKRSGWQNTARCTSGKTLAKFAFSTAGR
jgi:ribulose 1,5-bisphosphate synthetase/thiazole synthase